MCRHLQLLHAIEGYIKTWRTSSHTFSRSVTMHEQYPLGLAAQALRHTYMVSTWTSICSTSEAQLQNQCIGHQASFDIPISDPWWHACLESVYITSNPVLSLDTLRMHDYLVTCNNSCTHPYLSCSLAALVPPTSAISGGNTRDSL